MFEDAKGKELVYIQAQKDLRKLVKNDESEQIGNSRSVTVGQQPLDADRRGRLGHRRAEALDHDGAGEGAAAGHTPDRPRHDRQEADLHDR